MDIALAYREVETAEKLLADVIQAMERHTTPDIRDAFGRLQGGLQLGVPLGSGGHNLYQVPWSLARPVIKAHIATHRARISVLSEKALIELGLGADVPAGTPPEGKPA